MVALSLVVLSVSVADARTYLWCSMMERRVQACCCPSEEEPAAEPSAPQNNSPKAITTDCCQRRASALPAVKVVTTEVARVPMRADSIAVTNVAIALAVAPRTTPSRRRFAEPNRPPPIQEGPSARARRAALSVYRC
jgi:hypothetical protein